jgi:anti-sigma B factor antagonist
MDSQIRYAHERVHVHGEMTVYTAGVLKPHLLAQLTQHADASELELSRVTEIDTAGLQILLTARRHARELGRQMRVVNPSQAVTEVLQLCRLTEFLAAPAAPAESR